MTRRLLASLFVLATAFGLVAAADRSPVKAPTRKTEKRVNDLDPKVLIKDAAVQQDRLQRQFNDVKAKLLRLAQRLENSSKPEDVEKAKVLRKAIDQAVKRGLDAKFSKLITLLNEDKSYADIDKLQEILSCNDELRKEIHKLIELLRKDDRDAQLKKQREEMAALLERLKELIARQERLQAKTDIRRTANKDLEKSQIDLAKDTRRLFDPKAGKNSKGTETKNTASTAKDGKGKEGQAGKPAAAKDPKAKDGEGKDTKGSKGGEGKDAKGGKPKDGKGGEGKDAKPKDGKGGEGKDGKPKDGKGGEGKDGKPKDGKGGEGKPGTGKPKDGKGGEGKDGKPGAPKGGKPSQGKDAKSKDGKGGEGKPGAGKPSKPGETKPTGGSKPSAGKPSTAKAGKPGAAKPGASKGKPSSGKPSASKGKPGAGKPSSSPSGDPKSGSPKSGDSQPQETSEARKKIQDSNKYQNKAADDLKKDSPDKASDDMGKAIAEMKKAQKELEELLRQLREEEIERLLAKLQGRCQKMLADQIAVYDGTVALDKVIKARPGKQPLREDAQNSNALSDKEEEIVLEANTAIRLIEAEGSAVAFGEVFKQVRADMITIAANLRRTDDGAVTQTIEKDVIETLKEMVEALKEARKQNKQPSKPGKPGQAGGKPQDQKLISMIAELKMIRARQLRINNRTTVYGKQYDGEQVPAPETAKGPKERETLEILQKQLKQLAVQQDKMSKVTNDIAKGKNEAK